MSDDILEQFLYHKPKTENELFCILPDGTYDAIIRKIEVKKGKNPNKITGEIPSYFVATLEIKYNGDLFEIISWLCFDHLVRHMYDSCGKIEDYNKERLSNKDCEGKKVSVLISTQEGNEKYPKPKNIVKDFFKPKKENLIDNFEDNSLPF